MTRKRVLSAGVVALFAVAIAAAASAGSEVNPGASLNYPRRGTDPQLDQIRDGKAKRLADQPSDVHWVGFWVNCKWNIIPTRNSTYEVNDPRGPNGKSRIQVQESTPAEIMAQLPEPDPACASASSTQEEANAMVAEVNARNATTRGRLPAPLPTIELPVRR